jgi:hypothetical protein
MDVNSAQRDKYAAVASMSGFLGLTQVLLATMLHQWHKMFSDLGDDVYERATNTGEFF